MASSDGDFLMEAKADLIDALERWVEENTDEFLDHDDAYDMLNEIFQPILDKSPVAV